MRKEDKRKTRMETNGHEKRIREEHSIIRGKVYVVGDNIDTDQIIPAQYLNLVPTIPEEYQKLGTYALSGLPSEYPAFVKEGAVKSEFTIVIAGRNFGCGSSREHAPIALGAAGVQAVVAESYARIFFRNAIATGALYPLELDVSPDSVGCRLRGSARNTSRLDSRAEKHYNVFHTGDLAEVHLDREQLLHVPSGTAFKLKSMGDAAPVIKAGGLFEYARKKGMIQSPEATG